MNFTSPNTWVLLIIAFLIGVLLTWLLMRKGSSAKFKKAYADLQEKHQNLQNNIDKHFQETAQSIDQLTDSYKAVFTQLSKGANQLMSQEAFQNALQQRNGKSVTLTYLSNKNLVADSEESIDHQSDSLEKTAIELETKENTSEESVNNDAIDDQSHPEQTEETSKENHEKN